MLNVSRACGDGCRVAERRGGRRERLSWAAGQLDWSQTVDGLLAQWLGRTTASGYKELHEAAAAVSGRDLQSAADQNIITTTTISTHARACRVQTTHTVRETMQSLIDLHRQS